MMNKYPKQYYEFFTEFNQGEYYKCHDLLEEIWLADRNNLFIKGLLQLAVALYHFNNGNIIGARKLFSTSYKYLQMYKPEYWDLEINSIIEYIELAIDLLPNERNIPIDELNKIGLPEIKLYLQER